MIIERDIYSEIKKVIGAPEAVIVTGMRRVGKTTLLSYILDKIQSENKIFLDFENPLNKKYFEEEDYEAVLQNLKFLGLDLSEQGYVFLDEVQYVKNIPSVVKYLIDHYQIKFFLSGSASFYLKNLFNESLSGRKYIFELFPLNFREFLRIKQVNINFKNIKKISLAVFNEINRHYSEFIKFGGFPGVALKEKVQEKQMMIEDIFSSYFQSEVKQLGDFRKLNVVRDLMLLLMERTGSKLDIQKLSRELKVSRETIYNYLAFLESTYFISLIRPFTTNRDIEIRSMPKFYLCDTGIVNHFTKASKGASFENAVFSALRPAGELNYYQRKSGVEIDFILNKTMAYEVKSSPYTKDLNRLKALSEEIGIKEFRIVSRNYTELQNTIYGFQL